MHDPRNSNRKRISKFSQGLSIVIAIVAILATAATIIGNAFGKDRINWLEHKLAHAAVGGTAGAILGDDPVKGVLSGATGAVVAEMLMEAMAPTYNDFSEQTRLNRPHLSDHEMRNLYENHLRSLAAIAKFAAASSGLAFSNVNTAFNTADNAVENNFIPMALAPWAPAIFEAGTAAFGLATAYTLGQAGITTYNYLTGDVDTVPYQEWEQNLPPIEAFPDHNGLIPPFMGGFQPYDQPQRPSILYTPLNPVQLWQDQGLSLPTHYPAFNEGFQTWQGGNPMGMLMNNNHKMVEEYEVGHYNQLIKRSNKDGLEIHHAPQKHPAAQVIPGYKSNTGPSVALREEEHRLIPAIKGRYAGTARSLLAKDVNDLRNHTDMPNYKIQELINLAKKTYPEAYKK